MEKAIPTAEKTELPAQGKALPATSGSPAMTSESKKTTPKSK
jgi:hypothetical protein